MIYIPSIRIGGNPCNTDCASGPCGDAPVDPCDPPPDYPVFDDDGYYLCGPLPNTDLGSFFGVAVPSQYQSALGQWTGANIPPDDLLTQQVESFAIPNNNTAGTITWTPPAMSPINCLANTSRYIRIAAALPGFFMPTTYSFVVTLLGKSFTMTRTQTSFSGYSIAPVYLACPVTSTSCIYPSTPANVNTFGTPHLSSFGNVTIAYDPLPAGATTGGLILTLTLMSYSPPEPPPPPEE